MANVMRLVFRTIFKPWRAVAWTRTTPGQVCIGIYRALPLSRVKYTWSVGLNAQNRRVEISGKSFNKWRDLKNRELIWKPNSSPTPAIGAWWQSRPVIAGWIIANADSLSSKYTTCKATQFSSAFSEDTFKLTPYMSLCLWVVVQDDFEDSMDCKLRRNSDTGAHGCESRIAL